MVAGVDLLCDLPGKPRSPVPDLCYSVHAVALCEGDNKLTESMQPKEPYNLTDAAISPAACQIPPRQQKSSTVFLLVSCSFSIAMVRPSLNFHRLIMAPAARVDEAAEMEVRTEAIRAKHE